MSLGVPPRTYTVVLGCHTPARLEEGFLLELKGLPVTDVESITLQLLTVYTDVGLASPVPGDLIVDALVTGGDFQQAIATAEQAANFLTPLLSLSGNALVPEFQLQLAYETTAGAEQREFKQWYYDDPSPSLPPLSERLLDPGLIVSIIEHFLQHPEGERIHRAAVQYQEALRAWLPQRELRAVMHLFMAAEALTKAMLRQRCADKGISDIELAANWEVEKPQLDGEVRRRLMFHEDTASYKTTKQVSDGLEHGFLGFQQLQSLAAKCRDDAGKHIRQAVLEFLDVPVDVRDRLLGTPYAKPTTRQTLARSISGFFIGPGSLAAEDKPHPYLEWKLAVAAFSKVENKYIMQLQDNVKLVCSPTVSFTAVQHGASVAFDAPTVPPLQSVVTAQAPPEGPAIRTSLWARIRQAILGP
jgi:hypothetical protein